MDEGNTGEVAITQETAKLSEVLSNALNTSDGEALTVGALLDRVADRGFGLALILLALPTLIPILPPGASAIVGFLYLILGAELLAGAKRPWLPRWARRRQLSDKALRRLRTNGMRFVLRVERFSRPRWQSITCGPALRFIGLIIMGIGILLFLPLPFMNTLPGLVMIVMGIGMANRDGVLVAIAGVLSSGLIIVAITFGDALISLYHWIKGHVLG